MVASSQPSRARRAGLVGLGALLVTAALTASPAAAQTAMPSSAAAAPEPPRLVGTARVSGTLVERTEAGFTLAGEADPWTVRLTPETRVSGVAPGRAADLRSGSYIGVGARPQPDGTLLAIQIYIFPEAQRGLAEGHRAWDALPETTMTNATIASDVGAVEGDLISLGYNGGTQKVRIGAETAILVAAPASLADLKPGTAVAVTGVPGPQGLFAQRLTIGLGGAKPR